MATFSALNGATPNGWSQIYSAPVIDIQATLSSSVATQAKLPSTASAANDYYNGRPISITSGPGFPLHTNPILTYDGATKVALRD